MVLDEAYHLVFIFIHFIGSLGLNFCLHNVGDSRQIILLPLDRLLQRVKVIAQILDLPLVVLHGFCASLQEQC